jgi:hypothetical protein
MSDAKDYDKGALAALALFSKAANVVAPTVNPAPVMGSAVAQAATNIHPMASRVSNSLVGGATGGILNAMMAPSGDRLRQGAIGFTSDAIGSALGPWGMLASPAINMALQHFTSPSEEKRADHADDRLKERIKTEFPPDTLEKLRAQAKNLELAPGRYYLPMKDKAGNTAAIAAFKTVGPKDQLVLATVLAPKKNPPSGTSLSHLMKQPMGSQVAKVDASPKQYTIRKNSDGRLTCTCKSFKFNHRAAGTNCKHIEAHLGNTKESANKLEQFLLNQGSVSEPQKAALRGQFGRLTERPTAKTKALTSQALALEPGAQQGASLKAMRGLMQTPHYPDKEGLARTRRINELSLTPKLKQLGGKSLDAHYWKDKDPTFFYDEKKRFATPGEYRAKSLRLGEETAPMGLRAEHVLRASAAKTPIDTKLSPEQGQLVMYPDALKVQRSRLNKQRTTPTQTKPWDATDMRQTLEHESAERKMVLEGVRKGKPTTPYSSHWGSAADVAANQVAAKDPKSQWTPNNPDSFIEKEHWDRLYKQHGGTRGSPIPADSRASRSLDQSIARVMARAPLNEKTRPDLTSALDAGTVGMPLHPELEARLTRDFTKLRPELKGTSVPQDPKQKSLLALEALKKRTRMKTSAEGVRHSGEPIDDQEEPQTAEAAMPTPEKKKSWLPALGMAAAAGLGTYGLLRRPSFSSNPALRKTQQQAAAKGFHRLVPVMRTTDQVDPEAGLLGRLHHAVQPEIDEQGRMNLLNRFKFWAQEGGEAIPVGFNPKGKAFIPNGRGPVKTEGVVFGRPMLDPKDRRNIVRGGTDIEGPPKTQRALTDMGLKGKGMEATLLQRHSPGAAPKTIVDLSQFMKAAPGGSAPEQRVERIRAIQKAMQAKYKGTEMEDFLLKPTLGFNSGGKFPMSDDDWGKHLARFDKAMADPTFKAKFDKATPDEFADMVWNKKILQGHTLHEMLKNPSSAIAQQQIPNRLGEWRVNVTKGEAPLSMMAPRGATDNPMESLQEMVTDGVNPFKIKKFVEGHIKKLPQHYREGTYGADVMPYYTPEGKLDYKFVELNPSERAGYNGSVGGGSGFLDASNIPWAGHAHYRTATGRHTTPVALAGGLAAAGTAGGLARYLTPEQKAQQEEEETPHPVG